MLGEKGRGGHTRTQEPSACFGSHTAPEALGGALRGGFLLRGCRIPDSGELRPVRDFQAPSLHFIAESRPSQEPAQETGFPEGRSSSERLGHVIAIRACRLGCTVSSPVGGWGPWEEPNDGKGSQPPCGWPPEGQRGAGPPWPACAADPGHFLPLLSNT